MCCSQAGGAKVLWALGTLPQAGSIWGHAGSAQGRMWRGGGGCLVWFWGPGVAILCVPDPPTRASIFSRWSQMASGMDPLLPSPQITGTGGMKWGWLCPWGGARMGRVSWAWQGELGLALPAHHTPCPAMWHGGLKQAAHACCCAHECAHGDCARLGVSGCAMFACMRGGTGVGPLQPLLPDVLPTPVGSSSPKEINHFTPGSAAPSRCLCGLGWWGADRWGMGECRAGGLCSYPTSPPCPGWCASVGLIQQPRGHLAGLAEQSWALAEGKQSLCLAP